VLCGQEGSELFGKTLHVNLAKVRGFSSHRFLQPKLTSTCTPLFCSILKPNAKATQRGQAVWSAEEWIKSKLQEDAPEDDEDD